MIKEEVKIPVSIEIIDTNKEWQKHIDDSIREAAKENWNLYEYVGFNAKHQVISGLVAASNDDRATQAFLGQGVVKNGLIDVKKYLVKDYLSGDSKTKDE